jgi:hypothetical protein
MIRRKEQDMVYKNIPEAELNVVRDKFQTLINDLVRAGLRGSVGVPAKNKVLVYALKCIGTPDVSITSPAQWDKFFQRVEGLRFDFSGLARYIESLSVPSAPPQATPGFSAADLVMLHDGGISAQEDTRAPSTYWKVRNNTSIKSSD